MTVPTTSTTLLRDIGSSADNARWGEFVERYQGMMAAYLKANFPSLEAEDIVQETLMTLSGILPNYQYDPEAKGYFHNTSPASSATRREESAKNAHGTKLLAMQPPPRLRQKATPRMTPESPTGRNPSMKSPCGNFFRTTASISAQSRYF